MLLQYSKWWSKLKINLKYSMFCNWKTTKLHSSLIRITKIVLSLTFEIIYKYLNFSWKILWQVLIKRKQETRQDVSLSKACFKWLKTSTYMPSKDWVQILESCVAQTQSTPFYLVSNSLLKLTQESREKTD